MARRKVTAERAKPDGERTSAPKQFAVAVQHSEDTPSYYSNHCEVSHTVHDFSLTWCKMPSKLTPAQRAEGEATGTVNLLPMVQVVIPASMIDGMIDALTRQRDRYKERAEEEKNQEAKQ